MRRFAGAFVRRKRNELLVIMAAGAGTVMGLSAGALFHPLIGPWTRWRVGTRRRPRWRQVVLLLSIRYLERRRLGNLGKGEKAEIHAGQAIEHALTAPGCAVARSVITIARVGDIDHLVATPVRLWVIETKYRRIRRERFPEVLRQIADNTNAVWEWAPAGTPVRGCLVLANAARSQRKTFDYGKEPIVVHTPASLAHELKAEARKECTIDERVAANVRGHSAGSR